MDDDKYLCPICGNHIEKKPYPDLSENGDPSKRRWRCQFCQRPLTAHFRKMTKHWKFDHYETAPFEQKAPAGADIKEKRRNVRWQTNAPRKSR